MRYRLDRYDLRCSYLHPRVYVVSYERERHRRHGIIQSCDLPLLLTFSLVLRRGVRCETSTGLTRNQALHDDTLYSDPYRDDAMTASLSRCRDDERQAATMLPELSCGG